MVNHMMSADSAHNQEKKKYCKRLNNISTKEMYKKIN